MDLPAQVRRFWSRHQELALRTAIGVLAVYAVMKLGSEFARLVFDQGVLGAIDLKLRYEEIQPWFAHLPVYPEFRNATYPPMSYAVLWLALGWAPLDVCRWLWAVASVLSLAWLAYLTVRESGASTRLERIFAALLPLSLNATGIAIGNGQLALFLVPMLWVAMLRLARNPGRGWRSELAVVALVLVCLVHPSTASPFFWIVLFVAPSIRPALLVIVGYVALTLLAAAFQPDDLLTLIRGWLANGKLQSVDLGYADLHIALVYLGLREWALPASGLVIALLGAWTFVHRRSDPWLLLGVTAIVARLWTYHGPYDDLLLLFPMVALFRMAKGAPQANRDIIAAVLLGSTLLVGLLPVRMHYNWEPPWPAVFALSHALVWLAVLVFLVRAARDELRASNHRIRLDVAHGVAGVQDRQKQ